MSARYVVDGMEFPTPTAALLGDGAFAPFRVFDVDGQEYLPGEYETRESAQRIADEANREVQS